MNVGRKSDGFRIFAFSTHLTIDHLSLLLLEYEHHIAEYMLFEGATTVYNYDVAKAPSGDVAAAYTCGISLVPLQEILAPLYLKTNVR